MNATVLCPLCNSCYQPNLTSLLTHLRLVHASFRISCNLQRCSRPPFKNFYTYRNHLYAFHGTYDSPCSISQQLNGEVVAGDHVANQSIDQSNIDITESGPEDEDQVEDTNETERVNSSSNSEQQVSRNWESKARAELQKSAAMWILKTRETNLLPQSTMNTIICDVESLYDVSLYHGSVCII